MKIVHLLAGLGEASGVANIARRFARKQNERGNVVVLLAPAFKWNPLYFGLIFALRAFRQAASADEVWVHCSWTFPVWYGAWIAKLFGKKLVVVPEGSFDPKRLENRAGWKKRLVAPLDRRVIRQADEVLALCEDEIGWVKDFEPSSQVRLARVPLFLKDGVTLSSTQARTSTAPLRVLFLGRKGDPLKGVKYLERAVTEIESSSEGRGPGVDMRIESALFGAAKEKAWAWCDVLCLPTLSDNFGLVVAEALERGKRVITTDGAPAWDPARLTPPWNRAPIAYLRGFRDGTDEQRVELLRSCLTSLAKG